MPRVLNVLVVVPASELKARNGRPSPASAPITDPNPAELVCPNSIALPATRALSMELD